MGDALPRPTGWRRLSAFRAAVVAELETARRDANAPRSGSRSAQSRNELDGLLGPGSTSSSSRSRRRAPTRGLRRRRHARANRHRAARRGRQRLGLELSLVRRLQRDRAGAAHGQRRALQAVRVRDAHRPGDRRLLHEAASRPTSSSPWSAAARPGRRCSSSRSTACSSPAGTRPAAIAGALAPRMVKVQLELGGKDPTYVRGDADPGRGRALADGAMYNTGQSCCSVERIYVHGRSTTPSSTAFVGPFQAFKVGDPMAEGPTSAPSPARPARRARGPGRRRRRQGRAPALRWAAAARARQPIRADGLDRRRPPDGVDAARRASGR